LGASVKCADKWTCRARQNPQKELRFGFVGISVSAFVRGAAGVPGHFRTAKTCNRAKKEEHANPMFRSVTAQHIQTVLLYVRLSIGQGFSGSKWARKSILDDHTALVDSDRCGCWILC